MIEPIDDNLNIDKPTGHPPQDDKARLTGLSVQELELVHNLIRTSRRLQSDLGREPTIEEIGAKLGLPAERLQALLVMSKQPAYLELRREYMLQRTTAQPDGVERVLAPEDPTRRQMLEEQMEDMLSTLSDRERRVLEMRFGLDDGLARTLEEVGREFGVTRERIRQIEAEALRKLRKGSP